MMLSDDLNYWRDVNYFSSISKDLGKISMLLTRSRTYFPMTNSLGCPPTKLEEIHGNKTIKETIMTLS